MVESGHTEAQLNLPRQTLPDARETLVAWHQAPSNAAGKTDLKKRFTAKIKGGVSKRAGRGDEGGGGVTYDYACDVKRIVPFCELRDPSVGIFWA